jgi:benzoyl-CoA reductase/2-hydroxyglutaryl-CoA dehydratase subunit BcrC/BadD/HgdB
MYQYMAHRLKVPLVTVDSPYYNNARSFAYFHDEFKRMVEKVQKITGHTLDEETLRKHVVMGNEQLHHLYQLQELRRSIPCPDPGMHRGLDTLALTLCGSNQGFADYMKVCYQEASERMAQGATFLPEGRKEVRTLWTYSMVPNMLYLPSWLEDEFGSTYLECSLSNMPGGTVGYVDTSSADSMLEGLAWRSFNFVMHRNVMGHTDIHVNDMLTVARAYRAEAAIFAGNNSCKYAWTLPKMMSDVLRDELGIPGITFEMDMIDARFAPHASIKALLTEFFQTLM